METLRLPLNRRGNAALLPRHLRSKHAIPSRQDPAAAGRTTREKPLGEWPRPCSARLRRWRRIPAGGYAARTIEKGAPITPAIGEAAIPATLNGSRSAKEPRLPHAAGLRRHSRAYCGAMDDPPPYGEADAHHGWMDGGMDFARGGNSLTILSEGEGTSRQCGRQITMGETEGPLSAAKSPGSDVEAGIGPAGQRHPRGIAAIPNPVAMAATGGATPQTGHAKGAGRLMRTLFYLSDAERDVRTRDSSLWYLRGGGCPIAGVPHGPPAARAAAPHRRAPAAPQQPPTPMKPC